LELLEPTDKEIKNHEDILGNLKSYQKVFIIQSNGKRYSIVAAGVTIDENDWDIFESPIEFRSQKRKES